VKGYLRKKNQIYTHNPHTYTRALKVEKKWRARKSELFCGHTVNSLSHDSKNLQWYIAYKWYFELL
jgi:hypothetical protein